ncbi:MAG: tetratricopeptide repeat protein [Methanotrichaceae archaeon]|nr:tetratricopeptide repeat protein [Methanotrichaceae archaeon]
MEPDKIVTVCIAVASLFLGAYNSWSIQNPPDSSDLLSQGNVYFSDGNYKSAIKCYEKALKLHNSYSNALKYKGFALFNLGLENDSMSIKLFSTSPYDSPCTYARELIDYCNSSDPILSEAGRTYFESCYQYLKDASVSNPTDLEALLYGGIAGLYLSPSPAYDPIKDFDRTLRAADDLYYMQKSLQVRSVKSAAWQGKGVAYLRMGDPEQARKCFRSAEAALQRQTG